MKPFAVAVVSVEREEQNKFANAIKAFARENDFSFDRNISQSGEHPVTTIFLIRKNISIDMSNERKFDEFKVSFFVRPSGEIDKDLPDEFISVIRRNFGDKISRQY